MALLGTAGTAHGTAGTRGLLFGVCLGVSCCPAVASKPLNIEQLLVDRDGWQLATAIDYRSSGNSTLRSDRLARVTTALRYGLGPTLELNARFQRGSNRRRVGGLQSDDQFSSVALGGNWLLREEGAWPALLLEARAVASSRAGGERRSWPSGELVLTAYRSLDPVVLSLSAAYVYQRPYKSGLLRVQPGASWSLTPQVNFAVNQRVTLIGGLSVQRRRALRAQGIRLGPDEEDIELRVGLGFGATQNSTWFLLGGLSPGSNGGNLSLRWFYSF